MIIIMKMTITSKYEMEIYENLIKQTCKTFARTSIRRRKSTERLTNGNSDVTIHRDACVNRKRKFHDSPKDTFLLSQRHIDSMLVSRLRSSERFLGSLEKL